MCIQVSVEPDLSAVNVTWAPRGDSADGQITALLPTFASQLRFALCTCCLSVSAMEQGGQLLPGTPGDGAHHSLEHKS